jgi:DNA-binding NtrC family response regulator
VPKNVLILDDDLGFSMWLGGILNDAGYTAMPASLSREAIAIADSTFAKFDLLIANFELPGTRDLLRKLAVRNPKLLLIGIGKAPAPTVRKLRATLDRPARRGSIPPGAYLKTVARVLGRK